LRFDNRITTITTEVIHMEIVMVGLGKMGAMRNQFGGHAIKQAG
jgi:hypothetical protein